MRPEERTVIIAPAPPQDLIWLGMAAHGLSSAREEEVAKPVVGAFRRARSPTASLSPSTRVQRYLTNIFEKVGVSCGATWSHLFFEQMPPGAYAA